ncbi:hypothetical protein SK128_005583 [Halocaridina rubra]|uniref:Uncharacterized protein n=1 Tax=Halocaridina rubra TaxID=373956 RepID=A0AAN9AH13_HALRR
MSHSIFFVAAFCGILAAGGAAASAGENNVALTRRTRGPSDGCGPNPLARLAQLVTTITGENLTAEDVAWHLRKDPYMWQEMLSLLQFRQYHNCMTTGEGARF